MRITQNYENNILTRTEFTADKGVWRNDEKNSPICRLIKSAHRPLFFISTIHKQYWQIIEVQTKVKYELHVGFYEFL